MKISKYETNLKTNIKEIKFSLVFELMSCFFQIANAAYNTYIQEAHGPHRSPEKTVQINKHI